MWTMSLGGCLGQIDRDLDAGGILVLGLDDCGGDDGNHPGPKLLKARFFSDPGSARFLALSVKVVWVLVCHLFQVGVVRHEGHRRSMGTSGKVASGCGR